MADAERDLMSVPRYPAWEHIYRPLESATPITDYRVMLDKAGLNWPVESVEVPTPKLDNFVRLSPVYETVAAIPQADGTVSNVSFGMSGERRKDGQVSNAQGFSFLQSLRDGDRWEAAGHFRGGRLVFGTIELGGEIVLDPKGSNDRIKKYLVIALGHDGKYGVKGGRTGIRVVCQNTLQMAVSGADQSFSFRHTSTVHDRMAAMAEEWRKTNVYFDRLDEEAQALFAKSVSDAKFKDLVTKRIFPKPEDDKGKASLTRWETRVGKVMQAWNADKNAPIKGTAWGAFQALTEANQWGRNVQKGRANGEENFALAGMGFDPVTNEFRQHAWERVLALK